MRKGNSGEKRIVEPDSSRRLDGWKEIAAYLKRDVRTVQRWEEREELPIRRHAHVKHSSVYAYRSELDSWWNNRLDRLGELGEEEDVPRRTLFLKLMAGVSGLILIAFCSWWLQDRFALTNPKALDFEDRDWVLITDFENTTEDPLLNGSLEFALERELSNSPYVNVVPKPRIDDTLQLMKRPSDARIDLEVGREICLRDGNIRALLAGRVEKLDSRYLLSVQLVEPIQGTSVAASSEEAAGSSELIPALHRLSSWVRESLGENLIQIEASEQKLNKVTTPSLRALQLFSEADALTKQGKLEVCAELLKSAIEEDSDFAAAYTWLAWALHNRQRPRDEFMAYAQKGVDLADQVSERERYIILGSYYFLDEKYDEALPYWEALVRRYPDDYWGNINVWSLYSLLGMKTEANAQARRLAELRPNMFLFQFGAASALVSEEGNLDGAIPMVHRAHDLLASGSQALPWAGAWTELFPFHEKWIKGDVNGALAVVEQLGDPTWAREAQHRDVFELFKGGAYLTLGRLKDAENAFLTMRGFKAEGELEEAVRFKAPFLIVTAFHAERKTELFARVREYLLDPFELEAFTPLVLARSGLLAEARKLREVIEDRQTYSGVPTNEDFLRLIDGDLAFAEGKVDEAVRLLEPGLDPFLQSGFPEFFLASETLADALEKEENVSRAIAVLERASEQRVRAYPLAGSFWLRIRLRLAQLYRKSERIQDALRVEEELRTLLSAADAGHPLLAELDALDTE